MHPFLDTKKLSDDQLLEKIQKCQTALAYQQSLGHADAVKSIEQVLDSLIMEQQNRLKTSVEEEYNKQNPNRYDSIDVGHCDGDPYNE